MDPVLPHVLARLALILKVNRFRDLDVIISMNLRHYNNVKPTINNFNKKTFY